MLLQRSYLLCVVFWALGSFFRPATSQPVTDPYGLLVPISEPELAANDRWRATVPYTPIQEYELQYASEDDPNLIKIQEMMADGQMGWISDIEIEGPGSILVLHRGYGRCSTGWCGGKLDDAYAGLIPEPAIYGLRNGQVYEALASSLFYAPHSLHMVDDNTRIWVTDMATDQATLLDRRTGMVVMRLGEFWSFPLTLIHAPPTNLREKGALHARVLTENPNAPVMCLPTAVVSSISHQLVFVSSGYCDARILVFNKTDGSYLYHFEHNTPMTGMFLTLPHSLMIDNDKEWLFVANREAGFVDVFSYGGTYLCSYDLRAYGGHRVMEVQKHYDQFLVSVDDNVPLGGAIVRLNGEACGVVERAYSVPIGIYPQHAMDFYVDEQNTTHFYIASPIPQYYRLASGAKSSEDGTSTEVSALLKVQWIGVAVGAIIIPLLYFIPKHWDDITSFFGTIFAWLFCQRPSKTEKKPDKKDGGPAYSKLDQKKDMEMGKKDAGGASTSKGEGCVYFIRHGESTSNERGIFAGIYDVRLTKFGELQAKQSGKDIKTKRLQFDRVYCSHLRRTAYTAKNALEESGNGHLVPLMEHDSRIAERSFGIFAGQNIRLLQQSLGYHQYEELLHSPHQAPPMGEKIAEVYARVKNFYETEIIPKVAAGEKVLVVSHQYALEPLALYLCGLGPEDYNNMNLPNGKAMSVDDLRKYRNAESSPWKKKLQEIGDVVTINTFIVSPFLLVACVLIRMWIGHAIWPVWLSKTLLILSLFVSTFYSFLEVDLGTSVQKCPRKASLMVLVQVAFRILFGSVVLGQMHDIDTPSWDANDQQRQAYMCLTALLWLTPPAITVPSLSLLWGGGLYLAVTASLLLSGLLPVLLIIYVATGMIPGASMNSLSFFYSIFVVALVIPAIAAHMTRQWKPVEVKKHSKDWKWLATPAYWIMLIVAVELYTPDSLNLVFSTTPGSFLERPTTVVPLPASKRYQRIISVISTQAWVLMIVNFAIMRATSLVTAWVLSFWEDRALGARPKVDGDRGPNNSEEQLSDNERSLRAMNCMDTYILLTTPNFFLFASMTSGVMNVGSMPVGQYMVFWAMFLWFLLPAIEQLIIASKFMSKLMQRSLGSAVEENFVQGLWDIFKKPGGPDGKGQVQPMDLVHHIHQLTTQDTLGLGSPTMRRLHEYTADQLKDALELAAHGSVQFDDFLKYFQRAGVAINLNLPDRPLKETGSPEGSEGGDDIPTATATAAKGKEVKDILDE